MRAMQVAVKTLKPGTMDEEDFVAEAEVMQCVYLPVRALTREPRTAARPRANALSCDQNPPAVRTAQRHPGHALRIGLGRTQCMYHHRQEMQAPTPRRVLWHQLGLVTNVFRDRVHAEWCAFCCRNLLLQLRRAMVGWLVGCHDNVHGRPYALRKAAPHAVIVVVVVVVVFVGRPFA